MNLKIKLRIIKHKNSKTIKIFEDYISSKESQNDKTIAVKYKIQWMKAYIYL